MKIIKMICAVLPIFLLCGCFDSRDIKDVAIIMGMAVDVGEGTKYKMISQAAVPEGLSPDGKGDSFANLESDGGQIGECIDKATLKCGKYMYMSHVSALVIGEKLAREGVYEILDCFLRDNRLRANLMLVVTEDITKTMTTENKLLKVPVSSVLSLERRLRETSLGSSVTVFDFASNIMRKQCATMVPIVRSQDKDSTVSGSAIFKGDKMVEKISPTEARGVLWLQNKIENAIMTIEFGETSIDIKISDAHVKVKKGKEGMSFESYVDCKAAVLRDNFGILNAYGTEKVTQKINETIKSEILASFNKMQSIGADVYGFGDLIYRKNPLRWAQVENEWESIFKTLKLSVKVNTSVKETGSILKSAEKI